MANTTNFNWETPDDTDLVKDGAAAIRTLGSAIDTSLVDLKGGTTDQVLAKNSNADMDFKWVADATGIPATIFDAKGDLIVASAADTAARLAVGGTNGHVLTVNSGATNGIEWAAPAAGGGLTLLDTLTLSGSSTTSATFSSAYKYLILYVTQVYGSTTNSLGIRLNADSGNNYAYQLFTPGGVDTATATNRIRIATMSTNSATLQRTYAVVQLWRPSDTDVVYINSNQTCNSSTNPEFQSSVGVYDNSAAITSVTILPGAGTMTAGTVYIYGGN